MLPSSSEPERPTAPLPRALDLLAGPVPADAGCCQLCGAADATAVARPVPWRTVACEECWQRVTTEPDPAPRVGEVDDQPPRPRPPTPAPPLPAELTETLAAGRIPTTRWAQPHLLDGGRLVFRVPAELYRPLPAWHSRKAWLGALRLHPRLHAELERQVKVDLFVAVMRELSTYACARTGRDINVAHETVAAAVGCSAKTVQRCCRIAERLGALRKILAGADMSLDQRVAVLGHYTRGTYGARARTLPNFYASVMPADLARLAPAPLPRTSARAVTTRSRGPLTLTVVHQPGRSPGAPPAAVGLGTRSPFQRDTEPSIDLTTSVKPDWTAAPRPTTPHLEKRGATRRRLAPDVDAFVVALTALLPGYRQVSRYRIGQALTRYVRGGYSPTELIAGLNTYLRAAGIDWITNWDPDDRRTQAAQAKYLVAAILEADRRGYIEKGLS